jgi:hypothetical protein
MSKSVRAVVHNGRIELLEPLLFPEGTTLIVAQAELPELSSLELMSAEVLKEIWDNPEDDVYAELL